MGENKNVYTAQAESCACGRRVAEITRTGVVQLPWGDYPLLVNGENLEELIQAEVDNRNPMSDFYGQFAAKVTIRVELLGDLRDQRSTE